MRPGSARVGFGTVGGLVSRLLRSSKKKPSQKENQLHQLEPIKTVDMEIVEDLDNMIAQFNSTMANQDKKASLVRFEVLSDTSSPSSNFDAHQHSPISVGVVALMENADDTNAIEAMDLDLHAAAKAPPSSSPEHCRILNI